MDILACAATSYIFGFLVHIGKGTVTCEDVLACGVFLALFNQTRFGGKWRQITADNIYSSVKLACRLLENRTYYVGVQRPKRVGFPSEIMSLIDTKTKDG